MRHTSRLPERESTLIESCTDTGKSYIQHVESGRLTALARRVRGRLRLSHRRGWFSPSWLAHFSGPILRHALIPFVIAVLVGGGLFSPKVEEWLLGHLCEVGLGVATSLILGTYWWWATGDASAREDMRQIALHGRIAMPAGDLVPADLVPSLGQTAPETAFLSRRLIPFESPNALDTAAHAVIPSLLPEGRPGRRVAIVGAAALGKTRLVHELVSRLPPETIVFAPSRSLGDRSDAELRRATRYLRGRDCILVLDDLNHYIGRTDAVEIANVVAEQASHHSVAVTCTTSTVPQVRNPSEPALSRFFGALDQYQILPMTDEQMNVLAADLASQAADRDPHDCGGNPGLFLFDFQRLRTEFQTLSSQDVAVLQAIHALFVAGISPIRVEQVQALASSGFGTDLATPTVSGALKRLCSMSFIRETSPIVPEEAFLSEFVRDDLARARMDEVEEVLRDLEDPEGLSKLGNTHYYDEDFERASRVMRLVADLYRAAGTSQTFTYASRALYNLGIGLDGWGRAPEEIEAAYCEAVAAGREAATPEGLVAVAKALFNLGNTRASWGRTEQEIEGTYCEAVTAGREASTPEGLVQSAMTLAQLGNFRLRRGRPEQEVEGTYRDAAAEGRLAGTPEGLAMAATALFNLGLALKSWAREPEEIEAVYRDAAAAGREAGTPEGLVQSAMALAQLGNFRLRRGRPEQEVEGTYRDAAAVGRLAGTPEGLAMAAKALFNLGLALESWAREPEEIEAVYRDAAAAGREAGTPEGLVQSAMALAQLGNFRLRRGRPEQEVEGTYRDAAAEGRLAGTPEGLVEAAKALFNLGLTLESWAREPEEIEAVYRDAAAAGREAGTPEGAVVVELVSLQLDGSDHMDA